MSKTPEELASEHVDTSEAVRSESEFLKARIYQERANSFLAGYQAGSLNSKAVQAAKEQYEARIKELEKAISTSVNAMAGVKYDDENT